MRQAFILIIIGNHAPSFINANKKREEEMRDITFLMMRIKAQAWLKGWG